MEFLHFLFHTKRLAPNTILSYRRALAYPLSLAFNIHVETDTFALLARSQFLARPPVEWILPSWNINHVLDLLTSPRYNYGAASWRLTQNKALFLLALATGNRASELSALHRPGIVFCVNDEKVILPVSPGFLYKNQRSRRAPPNIEISALMDENGLTHALCPVRALRHILQRDSSSDAVFTNASVTRLGKAGIASRLCNIIREACPEAIPRANDLRKVGASIAWTRGIPSADIIRHGFWTSSSTFINCYLVPVPSPNVPVQAFGT